MKIGAASSDLDEHAVNRASLELVHAAGRPDLLISSLSEYEREAWRVATRRTIRAYLDALPFPPARRDAVHPAD